MRHLKILFFSLGISLQIFAGDDYFKTLEKIISAIELGKGALKIDLNPGLYRKTLNGVNTFLEIFPETSSLADIEIRNGQIFSIKYTFSKPVLFINGSDVDCYGLYVRSIFFSGSNLRIDSFSNARTRRCSFLNGKTYNRIRAEFGKPQHFNRVLYGDMFQNATSSTWNLCRNNYSNCSNPINLIRSVTLLKTGAYPDGFSIKFKPDSKILLSDSRVYENYIIAGADDNLLISELNVIPDTKSISVTMTGNLNTLKSGKFQSKGCGFSIDKPVFENISFTVSSAGGSGITTLNGDLKGKIENTSYIDIGSDQMSNKILIGDESGFNISDFNITSLANNAMHLKLGIGSSINLNISSANFIINKFTTLSLKNSSIKDAKIVAEFFSEKSKAYFQGSLFDVTLNLDGGTLALNDFSRLGIKDGSLHSPRLEINTTIDPLILGRMDVFKINLLDNNEYKASDQSFILNIGNNSFISHKQDDPVRFEKDESFPLGSITYHFNLKRFLANKTKDLVLDDGEFEGVIKYLGNEQYIGRSIHLTGNLNAKVTYDSQFDVTALFDIDDGKLDFSKKFAPTFSGKLSFQLGPVGKAIPIRTPCKDDAELNYPGFHDEHLYPLIINLLVNKPIIFKDILIKFKDHKVEDFYGASNSTSLILEIPKGFGEYDPDHDNCNEITSNIHNEDRGADDIKDKQEVGRADLNVRNCTMHIWLKDASYPVNYQINFEYKVSNITNRPVIVLNPKLDLSKVKPGYIRHGCDDPITGAIAGFFVDVDALLNKKIQEEVDKVAEKISQGVTVNF